jgi:hypothetical protein
MRSPLEILNDVNEAGKTHPAIYSSPIEDRILVAAVLELEDRIKKIQLTKEDKPLLEGQSIPAQQITRGNLQKRMFTLLAAAGEKEEEVALKIHQFLSSLE